jgi:hypothetical protein
MDPAQPATAIEDGAARASGMIDELDAIRN